MYQFYHLLCFSDNCLLKAVLLYMFDKQIFNQFNRIANEL